MNNRCLASLSVTALAIGLTAALVAPQPISGQAQSAQPKAATAAPAAAAKAWTGKTPEGVPDLQGYWTNNSYTPLTRPAGLNKEFLQRKNWPPMRKSEPHSKRNKLCPEQQATSIMTSLSSLWIEVKHGSPGTCGPR